VRLELRRLAEPELAAWLSAADCVLFNYQTILTSGAACLTRSLGIPLLLPRSATTVDLSEPDERVARFDGLDDRFSKTLSGLCAKSTDFASAAQWRNCCSWDRIAEATAAIYRSVA
jgi:hypothetical protein